MRRDSLGLVAIFLASFVALAADDDYRTVATALPAKSQPVAIAFAPIPGHLGVQLKSGAKGEPVVVDIEADSPGEKTGLKPDDTIVRFDGKDAGNVDAFRAAVRSRGAGEKVKLSVFRQGKTVELSTVLGAPSRPMGGSSPFTGTLLGMQVSALRDGDGVVIEQVAPGSAAEKAKLKIGEVILRINDTSITGPAKLAEVLAAKKPDDMVNLTLVVAEKRVEMRMKLTQAERPAEGGRFGGGGGGGGGGGWNRGGGYWTKPTYRIAIIGVEYPDAKHNPKIAPKDWAEAMFSEGGKYIKTATGQTAYGSMHDYYWEQSNGQLNVEGKAFDYVEVSKKRMEYNTGDRFVLLREAMDLLLKREGKDALKDFDGVFFIYAGGRLQVARGSLYWPHKSNFRHEATKNWPYFICPEGGDRMANISVFCHEFGHMLGLPDLYAAPERPGMEGVGIWSAMANQAGDGKPQHFDAWSKEKLGWVKPVVLDPNVKQKLILAPIEDSPRECFKVPVQPDGSEYFLLENRVAKGFDKSLPAHGLLIWRVVQNRPVLEEAHGIAGPSGPRLYPWGVPFPRLPNTGKGDSTGKKDNDAFTPYTLPSSRSLLGGGASIYITNIDKRTDGKITFHIGYQYQ
jgi:M6 family metalloprotease-like protein